MLWSRAVAGDRSAFAVFYERHADRVFSHCFRRLGARPDAEDLTADVFLTAWRRRADVVLHDEVDILPWLLTTANYALRHHRRSLRRAQRLLAKVPLDPDEPDLAEAVSDRAFVDQQIELVLATLDRLRLADREIIELCVVQGLSPSSVADALGEPAGTIRARLSRALAKARRLHDAHTTGEADEAFGRGVTG